MSERPKPFDPRRPSYLSQFDGFRGYGMILILLEHLPSPSDFAPAAVLWHLESTFKLAAIALDGFFLLSGFLITRLLLAEQFRTGRISLRQFYMRRVLRIFPIYYVTAIIVMLFWPTTLYRGASLLLYTYNVYLPFHPTPYPIEQSWSLSVEEQFYLLWPLLIIALPARWLGRTTLVILPVAALATAIAFAAIAPPALGADLIYMMSPTRMLPIALGCFLAVYERKGRYLSLRAAAILAVAGAGVLLGAQFGRSTGFVPGGGWFWALLLPGTSLLALSFIVTMINPASPRWIIAPFQWKAMRFLGQISYTIYVIHLPLLFAFGLNHAALSNGPAPLRWSLGIAALSVAIACAWFVLVERPLGRLKSRLDRRPKTPIPAGPAAA